MSFPSLLAELEVAVKVGTSKKRQDILRRVTNLFLDKSNQLNEQQISVFDSVLVNLIQKIEASAVTASMALVELSKSLAPVDNAPIETIRRLAWHDEIAIAAPVLNQSNRLSESDLLGVGNFGTLFALRNCNRGASRARRYACASIACRKFRCAIVGI